VEEYVFFRKGAAALIILGIDPGYAIVGYGIIQAVNGKYAPVEYGAITTQAGEEFNHRLEVIYDCVTTLLKKYPIDAVSLEKLFFYNNKTTVIGVAEARGVILLAAEQAGVKVYDYTPNEVKIAVTGYGRALKPQVMEMTRRLLKLPAVPKPDDTADALAMAICHGQATGSTLRRAMLQQTGK
jgi:crossover junction endodeoxyribonuclease RuvC